MVCKLDLKLILFEAVQYVEVSEQVGRTGVGVMQVSSHVSTESLEEICEGFFLFANPWPVVVLDLIWCDMDVNVDTWNEV